MELFFIFKEIESNEKQCSQNRSSWWFIGSRLSIIDRLQWRSCKGMKVGLIALHSASSSTYDKNFVEAFKASAKN